MPIALGLQSVMRVLLNNGTCFVSCLMSDKMKINVPAENKVRR